MNEALDKIRKPSIFILLLILNLRFFFTVVFDDRQEILSVLTILFFFFSIDYSGLRKNYSYWMALFVIIAVLDFNSFKLNVLTPLILMQCMSRFRMRDYLLYNVLILSISAVSMFLSEGLGRMTFGETIDFVRIRHDFGFGHPNAATLYYWGLFVVLILYSYLSRYTKLLWWVVGFLTIGCVYLYTETISRSFIVVVFVFVFVLGYYYLRNRLKKEYKIGYSRYILYGLPVLLTLLILFFSLNVDQFPILDVLLSGRLTLYHGFLVGLSIKEFMLGTSSFNEIVVDNSYLHLMFETGIGLFFYFLYLYHYAIRNIVKQQNFIVIAIIVSFLVYGIMESLLLYSVIIGNNLFWILLYRYSIEEDEELYISSSK